MHNLRVPPYLMQSMHMLPPTPLSHCLEMTGSCMHDRLSVSENSLWGKGDIRSGVKSGSGAGGEGPGRQEGAGGELV